MDARSLRLPRLRRNRRNKEVWSGERVFPTFNKPPKGIYVVDLRNRDFYKFFRHLPLVTLQGLVSRESPRIYTILTDLDEEWLSECSRDLSLRLKRVTIDYVLKEFRDYADGYIIYDPKLPDTVNVATTMAAVRNCIVVHPDDVEWIKALDYKEFYDLRRRFKKRLEAYEWAFEELWPHCTHELLAVMSPGPPISPHNHMQVAGRDYVTALKVFVHYCDPTDLEELKLYTKILNEMPENSVVFGWYEEAEHPTVERCSAHEKFVVVLNHHGSPLDFPNPTFWSGTRLRPPPKFKLPPLRIERLGFEKVYITFYVTDGDNVNFDYTFRKFWKSPYRGKVPMAWTISPYLPSLAPFIANYYSETSSDNDTFVSGPSGAGYWYPRSNPKYLDAYLDLTNKYFKKTGLRYVEMLGYSNRAVEEYMRRLPIIAIKKGYTQVYSLFERNKQGAYYLSDFPTPVTHGAFNFYDEEVFVDKVNRIKKEFKTRPLFILISSPPGWIKDLSRLGRPVKVLSRDEDIVFVNFHEFSVLLNPKFGIKHANEFLREAKERGLSKNYVKRAEEYIKKAKDLYGLKRWWDASRKVNLTFKYLRKAFSKD